MAFRALARAILGALLLPVPLPAQPASPSPASSHPATFRSTGPALVDLATRAPGVLVRMRYATPDNFLKRAVYDDCRCLLIPDVAARVARIQERLRCKGLSLKVWDCYRPRSVQREMWKLLPDPRYVADPRQGSRHNRGAALDLTLVDRAGRELDMGTAHDDFSPRAHRDAPGLPGTVRKNRAILDQVMREEGFTGVATEWWHYDAPGWERYPLEDLPVSQAAGP